MVSLLKDKNFIGFVVKFLLLFAALYYGTLLIIGLSAPDDYYIPFVAKYLDYITQLKWGLMKSTKFFLSLFGIETYFAPNFSIKIVEGRGVRIAMSCVGYGVYSFWIAFVLASAGKILAKLLWVMGGLLLLWTINVVRIALFLLAVDRNWPMPLGLDHHTWFNIFAYGAIFTMMYFFYKKDTAPNSSVSNITGG